uniref:Endonuclease/exonuclease/phosphatase domain-containing protein n=1 Tax=Timema tahoe TaxID=61484 RepID=A0A7R9NYN6_9NEOP|nr:unnamed protein product [Timema tahoe]
MRSRTVLQEIRKLAEEYKLDVVCIQEPYTLRGKVPYMPVVARIVTSGDLPMSAIVIFNRDIMVTKITQLSNQWVTCVELGTGQGRVMVANLYFQFRHPIEPYLNQLEEVCRLYAGEPLIVTADANAKSPMWHSQITIRGDRRNDAGRPCRRGRALEEFIYGHGLEVVNQPDNPPTYRGRAGVTNNIDVTLCNAESVTMVEGWRVVEGATVSDHNLIVFDIATGRVADGNKRGKCIRYDISRANWDKMRRELILPDPVETGDNVNIKAKELTMALQDAMRKSIPVIRGDTRVGNKPWNDRLQGLRARARRARKRYQRGRDPVARVVLLNIYRERKREFEEGLAEEKRKSWEKYVKEELQRGPWGIPFKIAAGKIRPPTMLSTLRREDGSTTKNWEESALLLMETLLPDDDEEEDNEGQRVLRVTMMRDEYGNEGRVEPVGQDEVVRTITRMGRKKAPGPDGIRVEVLQKLADLIAPYLAGLLNECLAQGRIPNDSSCQKERNYFNLEVEGLGILFVCDLGLATLRDVKSWRCMHLGGRQLINLQNKDSLTMNLIQNFFQVKNVKQGVIFGCFGRGNQELVKVLSADGVQVCLTDHVVNLTRDELEPMLSSYSKMCVIVDFHCQGSRFIFKLLTKELFNSSYIWLMIGQKLDDNMPELLRRDSDVTLAVEDNQGYQMSEIYSHSDIETRVVPLGIWRPGEGLRDILPTGYQFHSRRRGDFQGLILRVAAAKRPCDLHPFPCVGEWHYAHCAWESNLPILMRTSGGAHVLAHSLLAVRASAGALRRLTAQMARSRPASPETPRARARWLRTQEPEPHHATKAIKLTAPENPTPSWATTSSKLVTWSFGPALCTTYYESSPTEAHQSLGPPLVPPMDREYTFSSLTEKTGHPPHDANMATFACLKKLFNFGPVYVFRDPSVLVGAEGYFDRLWSHATPFTLPSIIPQNRVTLNISKDVAGVSLTGNEGTVGMLRSGLSDIGATVYSVTSYTFKYVDFLQPINDFMPYVAFKQPPVSSVRNVFLLPFTRSVWLTLILVVLVATAVLSTSLRLSEDNPLRPWDTSESFLLTLGILLQQS